MFNKVRCVIAIIRRRTKKDKGREGRGISRIIVCGYECVVSLSAIKKRKVLGMGI